MIFVIPLLHPSMIHQPEVPMLIPGSFKLEFEECSDHEILVRLDAAIGSAGPVALNDAEADELADMISAMFQLLRRAQTRHASSGVAGSAG